MNLDRFQELTGREEEDELFIEHICDECGKDADDKCPYYEDISKCSLIKNRNEYYGGE